MTLIERLLFPMELGEFERRYLHKEPFAQPDSARCYRGILSWEMMFGIVGCHNNCWLPRNGRLPHEMKLRKGKIDFQMAISAYKDGRTILIRHSENANPLLKNIAEDFERHFKAPVDIQLYYTPEAQQGFDWHYDLEDVFIIQSVGSKEFRLRRNTVSKFPYNLAEMKKDFSSESPSSELLCLLEAGDLLYIPAGWWHCAQAVSDSAHLSVGVLMQTMISTKPASDARDRFDQYA